MIKRLTFLALVVGLILSQLMSGCSGGPKAGNSPNNSAAAITPAAPRGLTGTITAGPTVAAASASISSGGGNITVSQADSLISGLELIIPAGAYSDTRDFKISCAPIEKHSFGEDFNPITPLIIIENGGEYSAEDMQITLPVNIPQDKFAMGFLYDDKTKILEGMLLMAESPDSITVATRHFSSFVISLIDKFKLKKDIDTGFRPGVDDWQFVNRGSYVAVKGHCAGQSVSAMWYYDNQPDGKDMTLFGRYDNNGRQPSTPAFQEDDSKGYRLASMVQTDMDWDSWASQLFANQRGLNDELAWEAFAYSMQFLKQPQYVGLDSNQGGHAIICYRVKDGHLYVADPNYPGNTERRIEYINNQFKPYESGANFDEIKAGKSISYTKIGYVAQSSRVDWKKINQRWTEFKDGTIGKGKFPAYRIVYQDTKGQYKDLKDGYQSADKLIKIDIACDFNKAFAIYREGKELSWDAGGKYELIPGNNVLGIVVYGIIDTKPRYVDFQYINVKFGEDECKNPLPPDVLGKLQKTTTFKCELLNLATTIDGKGSAQKWVPGFKFTKQFYVPGNAISLGGDGALPIQWSGSNFAGGGSADYPDKLSGRVCYSNGNLMVSFDYTSNDPEDNLILSVKNVPCDPAHFMDPRYAVGGKSSLQFMSTEAPVVKGYVTTLEWNSHEEFPDFSGPPQVWDASLTTIDWSAKCGFNLIFR